MEKCFWRIIAKAGGEGEENVNEYLWLLVISCERYARDEIFRDSLVQQHIARLIMTVNHKFHEWQL